MEGQNFDASGPWFRNAGFQVGKSLLEGCVAYMNSFDFELRHDVTSVLDILDITALLSSETSRDSLVHALNITLATGLYSLVAVTPRKMRREERVHLHLYRVRSVRQELQAESIDGNMKHYLKSVLRLISPAHEAVTTVRDVIDADSMVEYFDTGETDDIWLNTAQLENDSEFPGGLWKDAFSLFHAGSLPERLPLQERHFRTL